MYPDCRKECSLWVAQSQPFREASGETVVKSALECNKMEKKNGEDFYLPCMWASDASSDSHFVKKNLVTYKNAIKTGRQTTTLKHITLHFLGFHFLRAKVGYTAKFLNISLPNKLIVVLSIKDIQIRCEVVGAAKITVTQQQRTLFMQ